MTGVLPLGSFQPDICALEVDIAWHGRAVLSYGTEVSPVAVGQSKQFITAEVDRQVDLQRRNYHM